MKNKWRPIPLRRVVYVNAKTGDRMVGQITHEKPPTGRCVWCVVRFVPDDGSRVRWISAISYSEVAE
jgi:hypothetical protein